MKEGTLKIVRDEMSGLDATPELDPAEVLGVRIPACITRVYAEAPTFSSFATAFTIGKSPLRQACHDFQQLADDGAESGAMSADLVTIATRAFRLACDNKTSKLCEPALEGLKLLCATGMIAGSTKAWAPKPKDAPSDENDKDETTKTTPRRRTRNKRKKTSSYPSSPPSPSAARCPRRPRTSRASRASHPWRSPNRSDFEANLSRRRRGRCCTSPSRR